MDAIKPVAITLPNGEERWLRPTAGARKLIEERCGCDLRTALNDDSRIATILWALMHDEDGHQPPESLAWLEWNLPDLEDAKIEIMAAISAAYSGGKIPKNEWEEQIRKLLREKKADEPTGSSSSVSTHNGSDYVNGKSGGNTSNANLPPEPTSSASKKRRGIHASA